MARRRPVPVGIVADAGESDVDGVVAGFDSDADADDDAALAVSAAEKENGLVSFSSTGPDDSGGVAVMVLGSCIDGAAIPGDSGCAVRGVSGYVEAYGVCDPCWLRVRFCV